MAVKELEKPPGLGSLYPKALLGTLSGPVRMLPGLGRADDLPDTELVVNGVEVDREHLAAYDRVCGFRLRNELPATYPHMIAFPLQMQLMTDGSFPFPVIGLVHIANRIELLRPLSADDTLDVRVHAEDLREHDRGRQFDLVAEASSGGAPAWLSRSTYLHIERKGSGEGKDRERSEPPKPVATWNVPGDQGRRYAAVSGDRNPIHMHMLTARLFGFPRPIAHGMWVKARCLAAIESELPATYTVEVEFKAPMLLPAKVNFSHAAGSFAVHDAKGGKPHLTGRVTN